MSKQMVFSNPCNVPVSILSAMVTGDRVTDTISSQAMRYLDYLEKKQIALNALIQCNYQKHHQPKLGLFYTVTEDALAVSQKCNNVLVYKLQFLIGLLRFFFRDDIPAHEIEDAQCYIKDLYDMLEKTEPKSDFFKENPTEDSDYRFDNIKLESLGLDTWFGAESACFEEKPSCTLM